MNADYVILSTYLCSVNCYLLFSQSNANNALFLFQKCLWHTIPRCVPIKKPSNCKKRTRKDTIPQYLRKLINKKKKMCKFMKLNKSEHAKFMHKKSL